ncbi:MAG: imidazoleglycerol-phosphate dehydratase HisB [Anaerolineae bacterium]|jgi:imidazoleglycerol-phosphate dehydratase|nr:imidazoleglycerol-phosphate dehydratase HisB [Anaerolineae bacterium]
MRTATIERKTKETCIRVELNLDGTGQYEISTGIGFFDHMLTQIAVHGLFDLTVQAKGDLEIDAHHTIEDTALVLGAAFKQALGDRRGITRMASAFVPMDEALGQVIIDFSGRPYSVLNIPWSYPMVANIPTSLIEHFFESFAVASMSNVHVISHYGRDNHHIAEAVFKAFARALAVASRIDPRRADAIPSSKGVL